MAASMKEQPLSYMNVLPGACTIGCARYAFAQSVVSVITALVSDACPADIVSRCSTRRPMRFGLTGDGNESTKNFVTGSSTESLPSVTAKPTAVDVKVLVSE